MTLPWGDKWIVELDVSAKRGDDADGRRANQRCRHIGSESNADNGGLYVAGGRRIAIYIGAAGDNHHLR